MESSAFDSVVLINGLNGFQDINDDGPGMGFNSRLDVTLPSDGDYMITANSVQANQTGAYTLTVTAVGATGGGARPPK